MTMEERVFFCTSAGAHKFWRVGIQNETQTVCWGRIGTVGQTLSRTFADFEEARAVSDATIAQKIAKGYTEVSREEAEATVPVPVQRTGKRAAQQLFLMFDADSPPTETAPPVLRTPAYPPPIPLALFDL